MPERYRTRKLAAPVRRALDVAAAIATEELQAAHVSQALELIDLADGRVPAARVTDIYLRLHGLEDPHASVIRTRVLAELGQRARNATEEPLLPEDEDTPEAPRGPFKVLRERFRGRVHLDLRRWMELHTGRSEVLLLDIHVRNALIFVQTLQPDISIHDAVAIYREKVGVREQLGEVLYWYVLSRMSEQELPSAKELETADLRIPPAPRKATRRNGTVRTPYRTI